MRTDHGSLTWLRNFQNPEGQLARWLEKLQELDFEIVHRQGRKHSNADALSRFPCKQCGRPSECEEVIPIATATIEPPQAGPSNEVREAQLADPELGPLLRGKEAARKQGVEEMQSMSCSSRRLLQIWDQLTVCSGVFYRQFLLPNSSTVILQQLVPRVLREEVLSNLHEGTMGGHLGAGKTLSRLKERPGHYNDVQEWCRNYPDCAQQKTPAPKPRALLQSVKTGYPLQMVAMDIVGPFPESANGNSYILVISDYFTRWTEAYAIPNQEATTIAQKLTNEFFRFSIPEQLHSDQGRNFESQVIGEVCKLVEVEKNMLYHPQSDGTFQQNSSGHAGYCSKGTAILLGTSSSSAVHGIQYQCSSATHPSI